MPLPVALPFIQAGSSLLSSLLGGKLAKKEQDDPLRKQQNKALKLATQNASEIPQAAANAANLASNARNQQLVSALKGIAASRSGLNTLQSEQAAQPTIQSSAFSDAAGQAQSAAEARARAANALSNSAAISSQVESARRRQDLEAANQFASSAAAIPQGLSSSFAPIANIPSGEGGLELAQEQSKRLDDKLTQLDENTKAALVNMFDRMNGYGSALKDAVQGAIDNSGLIYQSDVLTPLYRKNR